MVTIVIYSQSQWQDKLLRETVKMERITWAPLLLTQLMPAKNRGTAFGMESIHLVIVIVETTLLVLSYS